MAAVARYNRANEDAIELGLLTAEEFDTAVRTEHVIGPQD
jgi:hypothetical protein